MATKKPFITQWQLITKKWVKILSNTFLKLITFKMDLRMNNTPSFLKDFINKRNWLKNNKGKILQKSNASETCGLSSQVSSATEVMELQFVWHYKKSKHWLKGNSVMKMVTQRHSYCNLTLTNHSYINAENLTLGITWWSHQ